MESLNAITRQIINEEIGAVGKSLETRITDLEAKMAEVKATDLKLEAEIKDVEKKIKTEPKKIEKPAFKSFSKK